MNLLSDSEPSLDGRVYAIGLMISSSIVISFTGLIVRQLDVDPLVMNFYRAMLMMAAVMLLLTLKYRRMAISYVIRIGWSGILGALMLAVAAL